MDIATLKSLFYQAFGETEEKIRIFEAPGRVNLIGEHIDYCGGHVLPVALSMKTTLLARKRSDRIVRLKATDLDAVVSTTLDEMSDLRGKLSWGDYPIGVAVELTKAGFSLCGCDLLYHDTVPHGCGLSSSAAVEVSTALCLCSLSGYTPDPIELAKICQRAEHNFISVKCGIMDQFASAMGKKGHAVYLNCDALSFEWISLDLADAKIVIINTQVKHNLAGSTYNNRRESCRRGFAILQSAMPEMNCLADVSVSQFEQYRGLFDDYVTEKRIRHVVNECERVKQSVIALKKGDITAFGRYMCASHQSLREDYEVSCPELDFLVDEGSVAEGVYGIRMTGGGFGGCAVAIVKNASIDAFVRIIGKRFAEKFGHEASFYIAEASDGCGEI